MLHVIDGAEAERAKYAEIWSVPEYKSNSPGLENVERFLRVVKPTSGTTILDAGCGAGVAGLEFERRGFRVHYLDITDAGLQPDVDRSRFIEQPLWRRIRKSTLGWDYGFCCDVMEHIPHQHTMLVVSNLLEACREVWFQIAFIPDGFGKMIGQPLHLTVMPFGWWLNCLNDIADVIDARDLCGQGMFRVRRGR